MTTPTSSQAATTWLLATAMPGRLQEAIEMHEATLGAMVRVLGPDHPDTLKSRHNLALSYRDAGRHKEADRLEAWGRS